MSIINAQRQSFVQLGCYLQQAIGSNALAATPLGPWPDD